MFSASKTAAPVVSGSFQVSNSLRFRSSASAYLNRTPSVAGNQTTWTWSGWIKKGNLTVFEHLFGASSSVSNRFSFNFDNSVATGTNGDYLTAFIVLGGTVTNLFQTNALFRDPSSWYHIVLAVDTTQATSTNRLKLYVNGVQQAFSTYNALAQNTAMLVNSAIAHNIASGAYSAGTFTFDGYMAEVNFIDGQALTPSSFGSINATTGVWQPARYTGSYGTNGFYLKFNNGTSTTTLGNDSSGNGNNWTTNNISLTAGSTYDWMIDSPTSYAGSSYGVGNYAVLNPLVKLGTSSLSNGNLDALSTGNNNSTQSTIAVATGKWYAEFVASAQNYPRIGIQDIRETNSNMNGSLTISWGAFDTGELYINGANQSAGGNIYTNGDVIGVAFDADTRKMWFSKNGTWINFSGSGANPATASNPVGTLAGTSAIAYAVRSESCTVVANFGQRPFAYTPPTGFKSLCTQNLPAPTIVKGSAHMNAVLDNGFAGALTSNSTIAAGTNPVGICISADGTSLYAANSNSNNIGLYQRNTTTGALTSNGTIAAGTYPVFICVSVDGTSVYVTNNTSNSVSLYQRNTTTGALTANGTIAAGTGVHGICISADGTSVYATNYTANNISLYQRNTTTGALTANGTIAAGTLPLHICVSTDGTSVYATNNSSGNVSLYQRNTTTGALTANGTIACSTNPREISISTDGASVYVVNGGANNISLYQRNTTTGALTANGTITTGTTPWGIRVSVDGTSVYATNNASNNVSIYTRNTTTGALTAYGTIASGAGPYGICISVDGTSMYVANAGGTTISLYQRATTDIKTTSQALYTYYLEWIKDRANVNNHQLADTVRGNTAILQSNTTAAETTYTAPSGNSVGWVWNANTAAVSNPSGTITSQVSANTTAGFSVVTYTGTGSAATIGHGLGVAPSMVIAKCRSASGGNWAVYHISNGATGTVWLNVTNPFQTTSLPWNNTAPTSSVFSIGSSNIDTNVTSGTMVAYCFAAIAGYSAFGSFSGNASTDGTFVYCGFQPKFVLVKCSSTTGNWYVFDSVRNTYNVLGEQLYPNLSNAGSTATTLDFLSNGFKMRTASDPNASATYIYAAFASSPFQNSLAF